MPPPSSSFMLFIFPGLLSAKAAFQLLMINIECIAYCLTVTHS